MVKCAFKMNNDTKNRSGKFIHSAAVFAFCLSIFWLLLGKRQPASKTAVNFYRKMGYDFKNGITEVDEEQLYRLEKFR